ncbi:sodium-dependent proline transporter-like [Amphibalanus amphitrite]|uniref:sodium-dependent proline transporter-like n=1 Tax=Amphibalanus amphitrite TaxID=1232801 RepID=UPI001C8FC7D4|nr:sodium-dependent proline transporter-like [Amphibalanus amphitrite]
MTSSRRGSTAEGRPRPGLDQLAVPGQEGSSWTRRRSDAVALGDDLMDQLTVPQARWARRPSAVEVIDDSVAGQLVVPIYEEEDASSDGRHSVASRVTDDKPPAAGQAVAIGNRSTDAGSDDGSDETDASEEDVMDSSDVCRLTSVLSRLGIATDLATLWRMPYMCHKYGVSFFVVYLFLTILIGLPAFYMEFALGQFSSRSAIHVWKFAPIFAGFGFAMVLLSFLIAVYGSVVVAWSMLYLFSSMNKEVPWQRCKPEWHIENCTEVYTDKIIVDGNITVLSAAAEGASGGLTGISATLASYPAQLIVSSEAFFWYDVADRACPEDEICYHNWRLVLCLLVIWCFICFSFTRKVNYKSKVLNTLTALLAVFVVVIISVGVLEEGDGAYRGLSYLFSFSWDCLGHSEIWLDAFGQLVLSFGVCTGSVICFGSRHRFRHNLRRDMLVIFTIKMVAAVVITLAAFIILGFLAQRLDEDVADVIQNGPELLMVVASQAMLLLPAPPFWSALFFLLLAVIGHHYLCFWVEPVLRAPFELRFDRWRRKRLQVVIGCCLLMMGAGLALVGSHGVDLICALDRHLLTWGPLLVGAVESIALCWVYGVQRWAGNMEVMLGNGPSVWWTYCWKFVIPVVHMILLVFGIADYAVPRYGGDTLPLWVNVVAGLVGMAPLLVAFILLTLDAIRPLKNGQTSLWQPDASWGPAKEQHRWETYGVTFVAPEPILMVHVDSILKPEMYGGIPHGFYLHPSAKDAEASDVLRQQEELRKALQRRLMMRKQMESVSKSVVIKECTTSSESESQSTVSSSSSYGGDPGLGRRKSILVQAALLRRRLESSLSRLGSDAAIGTGQTDAQRRSSSVDPAPRLASISDPAVPLDPSRLRTVTESEESGCDNDGYEHTRRTSQL